MAPPTKTSGTSETVLVVGATGNIGVSAVKAALSSGRKVLAVVRSQASANKLVKHVGASEGITFVEADVLSDGDTGIKGVIDKVRNGGLPAFQHVYTCGEFPFFFSPFFLFFSFFFVSFLLFVLGVSLLF